MSMRLFRRDLERDTMHHHQQTLRDLEAMQEPTALEIAAYFVLFAAAIACALLFAFSL